MLIKMLIESLIYSVILGVIVTVSQLFNARLWLNCYPQAIQNSVEPRTKKEMKWKLIVGIPFIILMFGYPAYSTIMLKRALGADYGFLLGFINSFVIATSFNVFDLLVLDWWIFCYINPSFLTLKGTKGMKEYKDYGFHAKGSLKGLKLSLVFSMLVALIIELCSIL